MTVDSEACGSEAVIEDTESFSIAPPSVAVDAQSILGLINLAPEILIGSVDVTWSHKLPEVAIIASCPCAIDFV